MKYFRPIRLLFFTAFISAVSVAHAEQSNPSPTPAADASTSSLSSETQRAIDQAVADVLTKSGAASASIAVVKDGKVAYLHAYGLADVAGRRPATTMMQYSIGSISKQFTAAAIMFLAQEGKLSLEDKVGRWLPEMTRANEITIREILSMTSGYQDFWPQDYVMPGMMQPTTAEEIIKDWAGKPLDFEPGSKWQYSNTNYVIAGAIVEKVAGKPLLDLLKERVFDPLQMTAILDSDAAPLPEGDPQRYHRFGLGPVRVAPKEGKGWMFAAGELAMTPADLAKWDISIINQTILQPTSYQEMEREVLLTNGAGSNYGLGLHIAIVNGRRVVSHGGEVSGFAAQNTIFPDDHAAVVVLTNLDATSAPSEIAKKISEILFAPTGSEGPVKQAKTILAGLQHGKIDRSLFTDNANFYFSNEALKDLAASLAPLGQPIEFSLTSEGLRGGMTGRRFNVQFAKKHFFISTYTMPDGKLEQYIVEAN